MNKFPRRPSSFASSVAEREAGLADQEEDRRLVRETLRGRESSFEALFRRHRDRIYRIAFRFTRDRDEALDVTQEVFIKAHRALAGYRERGRFVTWLRRIATHAAIDWCRRQREDRTEFQDHLEIREAPSPVPHWRPGDPRSETLRRELAGEIQNALSRLSDNHRAVFYLYAQEGLSYQEIADTLGCPIGTVMSRLHYARRYLMQFLHDYLADEDAAQAAREGGEGT